MCAKWASVKAVRVLVEPAHTTWEGQRLAHPQAAITSASITIQQLMVNQPVEYVCSYFVPYSTVPSHELGYDILTRLLQR